MIYTSYFSKLKVLPPSIIPIAICAKSPNFYVGLEYKKLAPKYAFFMEWKKTHDNDYYIQHFQSEVLNLLTPQQVVDDLKTLTNNDSDIVLVCYEKPTDFCHRHLVADWLNNAGYNVKEIQ